MTFKWMESNLWIVVLSRESWDKSGKQISTRPER